MIYFLAHCKQSWTMTTYLDSWGRCLAPRVRVLFYEAIARRRSLPRGTYIFADLERLSTARQQLAGALYEQLAAAGVIALNNPRTALRRYDLLRTLHDAGINDFNAYRLHEGSSPRKFPVFVRRESDHCGSLTPLLANQSELDRALSDLREAGVSASELLVIEFCDTANASGEYQKLSGFRIGDEIVPRHILYSSAWVTKKSELVDDLKVREEIEFLQSNPHERELRRIFDLAGIQYGRIDYGIRNGRIQVWEINTNPTVMVAQNECAPQRRRGQNLVARRIAAAFEKLDEPSARGSVPIRLPRAMVEHSLPNLTERAWLYSANLRRAFGNELQLRDAIKTGAERLRGRLRHVNDSNRYGEAPP